MHLSARLKLALAWALGGALLWSGETAVPAAGAAAPPSHVILLDYQDAGYPLLYWNREREIQRITFLKEPGLSAQGVYRARLRLAAGTNGTLALAWDQRAARLHLDLNANLDLTDDPGGVCQATGRGSFQNFTNIQWRLPTAGGGSRPVALDLSFHRYGASISADLDPFVQVSLRSFWQGRWEWQGRTWQVAATDEFGSRSRSEDPGWLVIRPWDIRASRLTVYGPAADAVRFSSNLFWQGQAFRVASAWITESNRVRLKLELREAQPPLGELSLSGSSLHQVVLSDTQGFTTVLDMPAGTVQLPAGSYAFDRVRLKNGTNEAWRTTSIQRVTIRNQARTNVVIGGPLTNTVTLNRRGKHLVLNYRLVGANGEEYQLASNDSRTPPQFVIRQGDRQMASGKFEFG